MCVRVVGSVNVCVGFKLSIKKTSPVVVHDGLLSRGLWAICFYGVCDLGD